jgi:tRNA threonylcarbamoyladenosine biosynthesis protein TsaB
VDRRIGAHPFVVAFRHAVTPQMTILAIDTALAACSVAIADGERTVSRIVPMARGHAEVLMPLVAEVLADAGIGYDAIDRFAVTIGPGTFTGVRVGVAAVRGMALATGRPAIGVSTLEAIAATHVAAGRPAAPFAVAMDARREEVYAQVFSADGAPLDDARAVAVDVLAAGLAADVGAVVGTAGGLLAEAALRLGRSVVPTAAIGWPDPVALARLAAVRQPARAPAPLYLRAPDARPQTTARLARA